MNAKAAQRDRYARTPCTSPGFGQCLDPNPELQAACVEGCCRLAGGGETNAATLRDQLRARIRAAFVGCKLDGVTFDPVELAFQVGDTIDPNPKDVVLGGDATDMQQRCITVSLDRALRPTTFDDGYVYAVTAKIESGAR